MRFSRISLGRAWLGIAGATLVAAVLPAKGQTSLEWNAISSPRRVGVTIPVGITARDSDGSIVTTYTGPATLQGWGPRQVVLTSFEDSLEGFTLDNAAGDGNGLWHRSTGWGADRGHSAFYSLYYGRGETAAGGGTYDAGVTEGNATSPNISLANAPAPLTLSFNYRLSTEGAAGSDEAEVQISTNGTTFVTVAGNTGTGTALTDPSGAGWAAASVDLSAYTGRTVRVRFHFRSVTAAANAYEGWYIDDVVVAAGGEAAVGILPATTGAFVGGVWTGLVTVLEANAGVYLRAQDTGGRSGNSGVFAAGYAPRTPWAAFATTGTVGRLNLALTRTLSGGNATAMSGGAIRPESGRLLVVQDTSITGSRIQVYSDYTYNNRLTLSGFSDTEGMCAVRPEENVYAVIEEERAQITLVTLPRNLQNQSVSKASGQTWNPGLTLTTDGMEGLTYDRARHQFLAVKQTLGDGLPGGVYRYEWFQGAVRARLMFTPAAVTSAGTWLGDIAFDPYSTHLLLVGYGNAAANKVLMETDLDGNILGEINVGMTAPQGIAVQPDGRSLYIIGEANELRQYRLAAPSGSGPEGRTLELDLRLSRPPTATAVIAFGVTSLTAVAGSDYSPASGTVTIPAGSTTGKVLINILSDRVTDSDETIVISLTNAVNAQLAYDNQYLYTITDVVYSPVHYVSHAGGHRAPFGSWADAATNIQAAIDIAPDGESVIVTNEIFTLASALRITNAITVRGVPGGAAVIDGGNATRCVYLSHAGALLEGFAIRNGRADDASDLGARGGAVFIDGGGTLRNCVVSGSAVSGSVQSMGGGVHLAAGGAVENCTVVGNNAAGNGSGGGLYGDGGGSVVNTILSGNSAATGPDWAVSGTETTFTCCRAAAAPAGAGNIEGDPLFVNPVGGDYTLQTTSPCIDAGSNLAWTATGADLAGRLRRINGTVDMGAYEWPVLTIAVTADAHARVVPAGTVEVVCGANQSFTLSADPGFRVSDVVVDGLSLGALNSYTFLNVTNDHTLRATVEVTLLTLVVQSAHGGAVPPAGTHGYALGTELACAVTNSPVEVPASAQYTCTGWRLTGLTDTTGAGTGAGTSLSLAMTNDAVLAWQWATNYWLQPLASGSGSVTPAPGWRAAGEAVVLVALPDVDHRFSGWTGDTAAIVAGDANALTVTVSMARSVALTANFVSGSPPILVFDAVAASQHVGVSFPVTITAKDDGGQTVTDYTGPVTLQGLGPRRVVRTSFEDSLEGFTLDNAAGDGNGLWHRSTGRGADAGHSAFYSLYYGRGETASGGGTYDAGITEGNATSPNISLSNAAAPVTLSFAYRLSTEGLAGRDEAEVQVSTNGATFVTVAGNTGTGTALPDPTGADWAAASVDLSAYTGTTVRVRFHFRSVTAEANAHEGWYVDDVVVTAGGQASLAISPAATAAFVSGAWSGMLTVLEANDNMVLRATDGLGLTADSNPFATEYAPRTPWAAFATTGTVGRLSLTQSRTLMGGNVTDMSGGAIRPESGRLMVVENNNRTVAPNGPRIQTYSDLTYTNRIVLSGFDDTEGMCAVWPEENLYAVVEEERADITLITIPPALTNMTLYKASGQIWSPGFTFATDGMEGITYDRARHQFLAVKQTLNGGVPGGVYRYEWFEGAVRARLLFTPAAVASSGTWLGDLALDPYSTRLLLVCYGNAAANKVLLETDLDGNVLGEINIGMSSPQGIAMQADGKGLSIISEQNELRQYRLAAPSGRGSEGRTLELEVRLSRPPTNTATIAFGVTSLTAVAGADYAPAAGTLTIPAGATTGTLRLDILSDRIAEGDETIVISLTNAVNAQLAYDDQYLYTITDVTGSMDHYVSHAGGHIAPFASWADAATNIQAAIDVAIAGDSVIVTNATFTLAAALRITNAITVRGVAGAAAAVLDGGNGTRCVYLGHAGALFERFAIRNGRVGDAAPLGARGGAVFIAGGGTLRNCLVSGSTAAGSELSLGGGIYLSTGGTVENCTVVGNSADGAGSGGGVYGDTGGALINTILSGNTAATGPDWAVSGAATTFTCCRAAPAPAGAGNTSDDPLFMDASGGDYTLQTISPCIDEGSNLVWTAAAVDLAGRVRRINGTVDMGAYESALLTIVATADAHGVVTPAGDVAVLYGADQAFTLSADEGYLVADVVVDGSSQGPLSRYTFLNVTNNHTLHVAVAAAPTVTLDVRSAHGGAAPAVGVHSYALGTGLSCAITNSPVEVPASAQFTCTGWRLTGQTDATGADTGAGATLALTLTNNAVLEWQWATNYWLQTAASGNGAVTPVPAWHAAGAEVVLTGIPADGHHFAGWTGDTGAIVVGDAASPRVTVRVHGPLTLTAAFGADSRTLTVASAYDGAVPGVGANPYAYGTVVTAQVTNSPVYAGALATQYVCTGWVLAGQPDLSGAWTGTSTNLTLVLTNDASLAWAWQTNYWLQTDVSGNGMVGPVAGWQGAGSNVVVTATAAANHHFVRWSGDTNALVVGEAGTATVTVSLLQPVALVAHFASDAFTLDVASAHGGADPEVGPHTYDYGTAVACRITNSPTLFGLQATQLVCTGWSATGITDGEGNAAGAGTNVTLAVTADGTLTWAWQTNYWLQTDVSGNGMVGPVVGWQGAGSNVVVTATPAANHHFVRWSGDTNALVVGEAGMATVTVSLLQPVALVAHFASDAFTLDVASAHGGADPEVGPHTYDYGTAVACRITNSPTLFGVQATQLVCTGWSATGIADGEGHAAGAGTNVTLAVTADGTLTWAWQTNYWLQTDVSGNGMVGPAAGWQGAGSNVVVTATPAANHHFVRWSGDTNALVVGEAGTATVTVSLLQPVALVAHFASDAFTLDVASAHGGADPEVGPHTYDYGTAVACRITNSPTLFGVQATQLVCTGWSATGITDGEGNAAGAGTNVTLAVTADGTLTWAWQTNYWLQTDVSGNGMVGPAAGWQGAGSNVVVTATAAANHHFVRWSGDTNALVVGEAGMATVTVSLLQPVALVAHFASDAFTLDVASAHGGADPVVGPHTYDYGTAVACRITNSPTLFGVQATQLVCTGWSATGITDGEGNAAGAGTNVTLTVTADGTLTWAWQTNYWLQTDVSGNGMVGPVAGWQGAGSNVVVTATPDRYYHFVNWSGSGTNLIAAGSATNATVTVTVSMPAALVAGYAENLATNSTPEVWLAGFGWTSNFDEAALADQDHDGVPTWKERIMGTSPTNATDVLTIMGTTDDAAGNPFVVSWDGLTGRVYTVYGTTNLPGPWTDLGEAPGRGGEMRYTNRWSGVKGFYRVGVRLQE